MNAALRLALAATLLALPAAAEAQSHRVAPSSGGTTRGSTRPVEARRVVRASGGERGGGGASSTRADRGESAGPRWSRRRRVRVALAPGRVLEHPCDRVVGDYCIYDRWEYAGDSMLGWGFSLGGVASLLVTSESPLTNARLPGAAIDAGLVPAGGVEGRAFGVYGRLRFGAVLHAGGAGVPAAVRLGGAFEEGSDVSGGFHFGVSGLLAYAPQVADSVQLWLGVRAGWYLLSLDVRSQGRLYDRLHRSFVTAGPEVGVRFDDGGPAGVMLWVFADLAQPGHVQATVAFHFEEPRPPVPVW